jgi:hypothetical protein
VVTGATAGRRRTTKQVCGLRWAEQEEQKELEWQWEREWELEQKGVRVARIVPKIAVTVAVLLETAAAVVVVGLVPRARKSPSGQSKTKLAATLLE